LKKLLVAVFTLLACNSYAQTGKLLPPSGLTVDLVGHADYQSVNGYVIPSSPNNFKDKKVQSVMIGDTHPAFGWEFNSAGKNVMQAAYQILVADNKTAINTHTGNVWDSGKVTGIQSAGIVLKGAGLKPNTVYYWTVRVWSNQQKDPGAYAKPVMFYTDTVLTNHKPAYYPTQITEQKPASFKKYNGVYKIDFGKDAFGQVRLNLFADRDSESVTVRIGEVLDANGNVNRKPPGTIRYAQYVVPLHKGLNVYKIKINKNAGNTRPLAIKIPSYIGEVTPFRYCEVEGYNHQLKADDVTRLFAHYPFNNNAAQFHSSDTTLNAVWELCKYSMEATSYLGTYVDGDRERLAYEADTYINQLSHYAVDKEYTIARKTHEHLITTPTWPTEWILQSVLIAWNDYLYTGDIQSVKYYYDDLKAKSLTSLEDSTGLISTLNGKLTRDVLASIHFVSGTAIKDIVDWPHGAETDNFVFTKYNAVVNAFYYRALTIMQKLAVDMGKPDDAKYYAQKAAALKIAYQKTFFDPKQNLFVDGVGTNHASLHTNMLAMAFGLVDKDQQPAVLNFIKSRGMACSVYGSQFLLDAVYKAGDGDYGLSLLTSKTDRSWYNMIRVGSTITLEAWDNKYKPNQDWNHAWGAAAGNIISRKLMGIEPLTPGWTKFSVKPQIGDLKNASIDVPTVKGTVKAAYHQNGKSFEMDVLIPGNSKADIYLPLKVNRKWQAFIDGKKVGATHYAANEKSYVVNDVGSGRHHLKVEYL